MNFTGELNTESQNRVLDCDLLLRNPLRLQALERARLMNTPREQAFDRLTSLAARILKVPTTIVSLISDEKQFFKSDFGLISPFDETREISLEDSICRYTLNGEPIISRDMSTDPLMQFHPSRISWRIGAMIIIPIKTSEGHVIGAFCAIDTNPRDWTDLEVEVMQELSATVMTEISLREQIEQVQSERKLRENFVVSLSHDVRAPLTVSKLSAHIIAKSHPESPQIQKVSHRIAENIDRADRMIQDLLDVNHIKGHKKVPLHLKECHLNDLVRRTFDNINYKNSDRFILNAEDEIVGLWDSNVIRRMLDNLILNAVKYGTSCSPITVKISTSLGRAEIQVHNHGLPLTAEEMLTVFEPFHRTKSATEGEQKGWGLGLTLVRGFAEAHGGYVNVSSSFLEGTTFKVSLPVDSRYI